MAKLQSTPLTFGGDWILHPNISEFWFDTLTFGSVSKSHSWLDFVVNCQVILLMCFIFYFSPNKIKTTQLQWNDVMTWHLLNALFCPKRKQPSLLDTWTIPYLSNPWTKPSLPNPYDIDFDFDMTSQSPSTAASCSIPKEPSLNLST